jgi:hypothetical protein
VHPVIFTPRASDELIDAQDWYENEARGLGRLGEVKGTR